MVILTAVSSVMAGIGLHRYVLLCLNLITLILLGFNQAINPLERSHKAHEVSVEFRELASNVKQFILSNHRTVDEIKHQTEITHELLNVWVSLSPPCQQQFMNKAKHECASRSRKHKQYGSVLHADGSNNEKKR